MSIQFDLSKDQTTIIKVIGVGGGGNNAVNHMFREGIVGVDFVICNTDQQALDLSPVTNKIGMGQSFTEGRGAGMDPEVGRRAAEESIDHIKDILSRGTKMVFITAGMGKGTGTGGAPVIAKAAKELGILTVGLVTTPFSAEGPKRLKQAHDGIIELKKYVDTILVISNDKLREIHGNLSLSKAFGNADSILTNAAKSIAEIITVAGHVNVDFNDVNTVMRNSGVAIMGTAIAEGENRAMKAVEAALNSPLLNDSDIKGANNILLNITSGKQEVTLDEVTDIQEYVQLMAGSDTNIIWGVCTNDLLEDKISVTIIATGFQSTNGIKMQPLKKVSLNDTYQNNQAVNNNSKEVEENKVDFNNNDSEPIHAPIDFTNQSNGAIKTEYSVVEIELPFVQKPTVQNNIELAQESYSSTEEMVLKTTSVPSNSIPRNEDVQHSQDLHQKKVDRLRNMNYGQFKNASVHDRENVPAYVRKNIAFKDFPPSDESNTSAYYLEMPDENNPNKQIEFKKNQFLHGHDRVD
jgi:cell division protein FtsZ